MNLRKQRAEAFKLAQEAQKAMKAEQTSETVAAAEGAVKEVRRLDQLIEQSDAVSDRFNALNTEGKQVGGHTHEEQTVAKSLGDHFVKHAALETYMGQRNWSTAVAPFEGAVKQPDDVLTDGPAGPMEYWLNEIDPTILKEPRRPTITSLFGKGNISGQAITYFVEGQVRGEWGMTEEGGPYTQLDMTKPTQRTDTLAKIGGYIRLSDEMLMDLPFLVSEINSRLMYQLDRKVEDQVLYGDGIGNNIQGLTARNGIQVIAGVPEDELADELFRSFSLISNATNLQADAIVINPADYERLRLEKDGNGQYLGGGFFQGQYGSGGFAMYPPLWGMNTVVTPAVSPRTLVVGAFKQGGTVYEKGGVSVEATNSNEDDFLTGMVTIRGTKRLAMAVRVPAAFRQITLA